MSFQDKKVFITGAARGIGQATALAFAKAGAVVGVNDINPVGIDKTIDLIADAGGKAMPYMADIANKLSLQTVMYDFIRDAGGIDILINNAAIEATSDFLKTDEFEWNRTMDVNLKGAFLATQTAARAMKDSGGGTVINVASTAGQMRGLANRVAYVTSKAGLIGLTKAIAEELAPFNIRVNAVCPGIIQTAPIEQLMRNTDLQTKWEQDIPQSKLGQPEDVAAMILFLASDAAHYITGQAINVDGGKVMR